MDLNYEAMLDTGVRLQDVLCEVRAGLLRAALQRNGSVDTTARLLSVSPTTLRRYITNAGLDGLVQAYQQGKWQARQLARTERLEAKRLAAAEALNQRLRDREAVGHGGLEARGAHAVELPIGKVAHQVGGNGAGKHQQQAVIGVQRPAIRKILIAGKWRPDPRLVARAHACSIGEQEAKTAW